MTLLEFRNRYPFQPNVLCQHQDGRYLEVISYPYCDDGQEETGPVFVKARVPNDPTTCQTYRLSGDTPELVPVMAVCQRDQTTFVPEINNGITHNGGITCPTCGRGYYREENQWLSDRPLQLEAIHADWAGLAALRAGALEKKKKRSKP